MSRCQFASAHPQPAPTVAASSGGSLSGSGSLYFALVARNREGYTLTSTPTSQVSWVAGNQIGVTIPSSARADGDDIRRWVLVAGTTNAVANMKVLAEFRGYESDEVTATTLPGVIALTQNAHVTLPGSVANPAALPSSTSLIRGMRRYVTSLAKWFRYDPDSTATENSGTIATVLNASPAGRWLYTAEGDNVYIASQTDPNQKGCDRDIRDVDQGDVEFPQYSVNATTSIPVRLMWVNSEVNPIPLPRGTRINIAVYVNGENKSKLFDGKLKLYFYGYAKLSDGTLDTSGMTGIGDEIDYKAGASNLILQKDLPDGYGYLIGIACNFSVWQLGGNIGINDVMSIYVTPWAQSGVFSEASYVLGEDIVYNVSDRLFLVPADFGVKMLAGGALVDGFGFLDNPETVLTGLTADTAGQQISINGNGAMFLRSGSIPTTEALRGIISTEPGVSPRCAWSSTVNLTSGGGIQVTVNYPSNGTTATIRGDYPDTKIAGLAGKAKLNAPQVRIWVENSTTGEVKYFDGFVVVDGTSQTFSITSWSAGTAGTYPNNPSPTASDFGLFTPSSASLTASGVGTIPAGNTRVTVQFLYPSGNTKPTRITHDEDEGCILTSDLTIADLLRQGKYWGVSVQSESDLTAIPRASIANGAHRGVIDEGGIYQYNAAATTGGLAPDDAGGNPGRWFSISGGGGLVGFSRTSLSFTQPAVSATVSINTTGTFAWALQDQYVFIEGGGIYQVVTPGDKVLVVENTGAAGNATVGATVLSDAGVSPSGAPPSNIVSVLSLEEQSATPSTTANQIKIFNLLNELAWRLESSGAVYKPLIQGKYTLYIPSGAMEPTSLNGCSALAKEGSLFGGIDIRYLEFDYTADQFCQFEIAMPKSWNGSTLTYQVDWTGLTSGSGDVVWGLQAVGVADGEGLGATFGFPEYVTDTFIDTQYQHWSPESAPLTPAGTTTGTLYFQLVRPASSDVADTLTTPVGLKGVKIYYTVDAGNDA